MRYNGVRKIQLGDDLGEQARLFQDAGKQSVKGVAPAVERYGTQFDHIGQFNRRAQFQEQSLIVVTIRMRRVTGQCIEVLFDKCQLERYCAGIALIRQE